MNSSQSAVVSDNENISRYIFSRSHFNSTRAKWPAFQPNHSEVSVMRVSGLCKDNIQTLGIEFVGVARGKNPKAWVEFDGISVRVLKYSNGDRMSLDIIPEVTPHPRHANIKDLSKTNYEDWLEEAKILAETMPMKLELVEESEPTRSTSEGS